MKSLVIASDHAGVELKSFLIRELRVRKFDVIDCGTDGSARSVDYPDYAIELVNVVKKKRDTIGILICGTGIGMSIAANRFSFIRAALCHDNYTAKLSREHNDANVICVGAKTLPKELILDIIKTFLNTDFAYGRHSRRVQKCSLLGRSRIISIIMSVFHLLLRGGRFVLVKSSKLYKSQL